MAVEEGQTDLEVANHLFFLHEMDVIPDAFEDVGQNLKFLGGVVDRRNDEEFVEAGEERGVGQLGFFIFLVIFELLKHFESKFEKEVLIRLGVKM